MNTEKEALDKSYYELKIGNWKDELVGSGDLEQAFQSLPKSEQRAAYLIAKKYENYLTYDLLEDQWYFWDGKIHRPCNGNALVTKIVKSFYYELTDAITLLEGRAISKFKDPTDPKKDENEKNLKAFYLRLKEYKFFRDSIEKNSGQRALIENLKTEVDVAKDHYSDDRRWFVIENGVYDIEDVRANRRFVLLEHDASRPVYRMFNFYEDTNATHEALDKFTSGSLEDAGQAKFLQKITATALMGIDIETRSVVTLQGAPQSGKSMWLKVMKHFAREFVAEPSSAAITKGGKNPYHARYPMRYARFNAFKEITNSIDREFLLMYSGMDEFTAEDKWVKSASYDPQGIMFFFSNYALNIDMSDPATFDRIKPLNFPHHFERCSPTGHELDPELGKKIEAEGSGFLEWLKEGYLLMLDEGLDCTDSMSALKQDASEDNPVFMAINDAVAEGRYIIDFNAPKSHFIETTILHTGYVQWCKDHAVQISEQLEIKPYKSVLESRYPSVVSAGRRTMGIKLAANSYANPPM